MEQELNKELEQEVGCNNCGSNYVEEGYTIPLCTECRNLISKRKFPLWIKIFLICLAVIFTISIVNFPKALNAGIAYEKGIKYEKQHKYRSAANEFKKTTSVYPNSTEALCKLFISHYYNVEIYEAMKIFDIIAGREIENEELANEVNTILSNIEDLYIPSDGFFKLQEDASDYTLDVYLSKLVEYSEAHDLNSYEKFILANAYYDSGDYEQCKTITEQIVNTYPHFSGGNLLLAAVARETADFDKGIQYCNQVLSYNAESYEATAAKSRIELKRLNDNEGLKFALEAYSIQPNDPYVVSTLALAYHYNNRIEDRDKLMKRFENGELKGDYYYNQLKSIFSGTEKWRG